MDKLTLTAITATLLLLSISIPIPTTGKLEADNVSYIPAEGQEIESGIRSEAAFPHRVLGTFTLCAQCECCRGLGETNCSKKQCCYRIVCKPNNKMCSFWPYACNCNSCSES